MKFHNIPYEERLEIFYDYLMNFQIVLLDLGVVAEKQDSQEIREVEIKLQKAIEDLRDFVFTEETGKAEDQMREGVFCDIEGTLLVQDRINPKVLTQLKEYEKQGKPIHLWTGGNVEEYEKKLLSKDIDYNLFSKNDFHGCDVEIIIDDLSQERFVEMYNITARKFIQVK